MGILGESSSLRLLRRKEVLLLFGYFKKPSRFFEGT